MLTADRLHEVLDYDPDAGTFRWRSKVAKRVHVGDLAGCVTHRGYLQIRVDGALYRAHRLAWLFVHGDWPLNQIDHVNGDRSDNRLDNLREATGRQNDQNRLTHRNGRLAGAVRGTKRWQARAKVNGKQRHLGMFDTEMEAHEAYMRFCATL